MALIECPECKKEMSEKADACPHCGYMEKWKDRGKNQELVRALKWAGALIVIGLIIREIAAWIGMLS